MKQDEKIDKIFLFAHTVNPTFHVFDNPPASSMVELQTHDPKVVSLNPVWAACCVLEQGTLLLTCSSRPKCVSGYQLRLGR